MHNSSSGTLVVSLDLELYWGMRDVVSLNDYRQNLVGVRRAIAAILDLFTEYEIHASWASVGFLFFPSFEQLKNNLPQKQPSYIQQQLSPYQYIKTVDLESEAELHFAPDLIKLISQYPQQEIATHTFSHYYCLESGQTQAEFEADLQAAIAIAEKNKLDIQSLVFPRNQYNQTYLKTIADCGINCYRGNQNHAIYNDHDGDGDRPRKRILRLLDAYLNLTGHNCYSRSQLSQGHPINIPASHFLRPYSKKLRHLDRLRLRRVTSGLEHAASHGKIYHLWWHPHNFGVNLAENLRFLEKILQFYKRLNRENQLQSLNMGEIAQLEHNSAKQLLSV